MEIVKERPILMSAPMVLALLEDRKNQTRRIVKPQPECYSHTDWPSQTTFQPSFNSDGSICCRVCMGKHQRITRKGVTGIRNPYGKPGDRLWVKEGYAFTTGIDAAPLQTVIYRADAGAEEWARLRRPLQTEQRSVWRSPLFIPRRASRITLEITEVRVQRLNDISEEDAIAEGSYLGRCSCPQMQTRERTPIGMSFRQTHCHIHGEEYRSLWESINDVGSWNANPWAWAISFKVVK